MFVQYDLIASFADTGIGILDSPAGPPIITGIATLGVAFLMFRGKTQDTANWLIDALRKDAEDARDDAAEARAAAAAARADAAAALKRTEECEAHWAVDKRAMAALTNRVGELEQRWRDVDGEDDPPPEYDPFL